MKKITTALIGLTLCASAQAEFLTGNNLLAKMNSSDYMDQSQAIGYVQGVFDASKNIFHCAPSSAGITTGQVHDMVKSYLQETPSKRHFSADSLIVPLLKAVWPCPKSSRSSL